MMDSIDKPFGSSFAIHIIWSVLKDNTLRCHFDRCYQQLYRKLYNGLKSITNLTSGHFWGKSIKRCPEMIEFVKEEFL